MLNKSSCYVCVCVCVLDARSFLLLSSMFFFSTSLFLMSTSNRVRYLTLIDRNIGLYLFLNQTLLFVSLVNSPPACTHVTFDITEKIHVQYK